MPVVRRSSCVLGHDSYFRRAGATATSPGELAGWPADALTDESEALAWRPPGTSASEYITVDLGAGQLALPDYCCAFGSNAGQVGVTGTVESSANGLAWGVVAAFAWQARAYLITADPIGAIPPARWWRVGWHGIASTALRVSEVLLGNRVRIPNAEWLGFDPTEERLDRPSVRTEAGHLERSRLLGAVRIARVTVPYAPGAWYEDDDPYRGFRYWWRHVARAGRPTAFAWAGNLPGEHYRDAFYAHVSARSAPLATPARRGPRALQLTVQGARPWGTA